MARKDVIYCRISTGGQEFTLQMDGLAKTFKSDVKGLDVYKDVCSGSRASRPSYDKLRNAIAQGRIGTVYVWSWDRLSRSMTDMVDFVKHCRRYKTAVKSVQINVDILSDFGDLFIVVLGLAAEIERRMLAARRHGGLRKCVFQKGMRFGGSEKGWLAGKTRQKAEAVYDLVDKGHSINSICVSMRLDHRTVKRMIAVRGQTLPSFKRRRGKVKYQSPPRPDLYSDPQD